MMNCTWREGTKKFIHHHSSYASNRDIMFQLQSFRQRTDETVQTTIARFRQLCADLGKDVNVQEQIDKLEYAFNKSIRKRIEQVQSQLPNASVKAIGGSHFPTFEKLVDAALAAASYYEIDEDVHGRKAPPVSKTTKPLRVRFIRRPSSSSSSSS